MTDTLSIEPFRGDYDALERMAFLSWREEYGDASFPNFYKPAFIRYMFEKLVRERGDHVLGAYRGNEIVGFLGNVPQTFQFKERIYPAAYSCLLVVRREALRGGVASKLIGEGLKVAERNKYAFSLFTLETGHRSTKMMRKFAGEGRRIEWITKFRVIARIMDLDRVAASEGLKGWERAAVKAIGGAKPLRAEGSVRLREYRPADLDECLALIDRYRGKVPLALVWDREGLARELDHPGVVQTLVCEKDGKIAGLVCFIFHDHLGKTTERWAWVHHFAYPDLDRRERVDFVHAFLRYVRDAGCLGAIEWTRGYYPQGPLYRAHFFPYFRGVSFCSWIFDPQLSFGRLKGIYEIQV